MRVIMYIADVHACGYIRGELVAREVMRHNEHVEIVCKRDALASDMHGTDLMIFQRSCDGYLFNFMRQAQTAGIKCAYETDDDMLNIPAGMGKIEETFRSDNVRDAIRSFMQYADAIIVSTRPLAGAVQKYTQKPIYVCHNFLDCDAWELQHARRNTFIKPTITIGWTNSPVHTLDIPCITTALNNVLKQRANVNFMSIGSLCKEIAPEWMHDKQYADRVQLKPWIHITKLPEAMSEIDIGISPLIKNVFNESRSNIKWQQYAILGIPGVYSDGPVYANVKEGVDGLVAKDDNEWEAKLLSLVDSVETRERIGRQARLEVLTNWDLRKKHSVWMNTFKAILNQK